MNGDGLNPASLLKIGNVARLVGVSASVIRSWEKLGLTHPQRTDSRYRMYTAADVALLKRAKFLRKVRGLNVPAIVQYMKNRGMLHPADTQAMDGFGLRMRSLRQSRNLPLAAVAKAVGISTGFLSALERSQMSASVSTLRKLARYYRVNVLDFFATTEQPGPHLVRQRDRKLLQAGEGVRMELLAWGNTIMEPHLFRVSPGAGSGESYSHEGEEFLHVMRGELDIALDGQQYHLRAGDSFYFESATPHRWSNPGQKEAWVVWVNTPPTF